MKLRRRQRVGLEVLDDGELVLVALPEALDGILGPERGQPANGCRFDQRPGFEEVLDRGPLELEEQRRVPGRDRDVGSADSRPPPAPRFTLMSDSLSMMRSASRTTGLDTS